MQNIKKIIIFICLSMMLSSTFASQVKIENTSLSILDLVKILNPLQSDAELETEYYKTRIPDEYYNAFIYHTQNREEIRPMFYSIMTFESGFRVYSKKNLNGSIDKGPSHLNSNNIKNPHFMEYYGPKDLTYINSDYCYYMVTTINLYDDLYSRYGINYALYGYNGGEKVINMIKYNNYNKSRLSLIQAVESYDYRVNLNYNKCRSELNDYITDIKKKYEFECVKKTVKIFCSLLNVTESNHPIYNSIGNTVASCHFCDLFFKEEKVEIQSKISSFQIQC